MQLNLRNPADGIYAATPDYAHALEVAGAQRFLFVSGTMGLDEHGIAPPTLEGQLTLVWANLRRILGVAGMTPDHIVRLTSYLRDASYAAANQAARLEALGGRVVPTTAIVVQTLRPDWLVELEVIAVA